MKAVISAKIFLSNGRCLYSVQISLAIRGDISGNTMASVSLGFQPTVNSFAFLLLLNRTKHCRKSRADEGIGAFQLSLRITL